MKIWFAILAVGMVLGASAEDASAEKRVFLETEPTHVGRGRTHEHDTPSGRVCGKSGFLASYQARTSTMTARKC
jgi:hypothetical protein